MIGITICALVAVFFIAATDGYVIPPNISNPEQYATVLAWDQWVPTLTKESPFFGVLFLTVTPILMDAKNLSANTYRIDTYLYHDSVYALDAAVYGPAGRGVVNGSLRLFHLYYANTTAASADCPQTVSVTVNEEIIVWLRTGKLYAAIYSSGDGGNLRGQIETRNDLYFCALNDARLNRSFTGAALVRGYTVTIDGHKQTHPSQPLGVDYYVLSSSEWGTGFASALPGSAVPTFAFGVMPSNTAFVNQLYGIGLYAVQRQYIEKQGALFGTNSSNAHMFSQTWNANFTYIYDPLCDMVRLPLLGFSNSGRGNNILIYKPLY